jgi:hypothetical protein
MSKIAELEDQFHAAMVDLYIRAKKELGYVGARYLQMVSGRGGLEAAKALLASPHAQDGLARLWEGGRLDLSLEALVIKEPWRELFTAAEIAAAELRLRELEYTPE